MEVSVVGTRENDPGDGIDGRGESMNTWGR